MSLNLKGPGEGRDERARSLRFALLVLLFLFAFTHRGILGQNDLSRFVAVDSLVNRAVFHVDGSPHAHMMDRRGGQVYHAMNDLVYNRRDGHLYSSKPPVLTLLLAGVLEVFEGIGAEFSFQGRAAAVPTFLLTWLVIGGVSAASFYVFRRKAGDLLEGIEADIATVLTLGGTLFLTYSTTMNHHTFTAALILISFFLLGMAEGSPKVSLPKAAAAGFLMGLATVVDIGHGFIFAIMFGLYIVLYLRSLPVLVLFGLGSIPPLAVHCVVQYSLWGSILPVQMIGGTKDYAGAYWKAPIGPDAWDISRCKYWLLTLFSGRGLFVVSPILLVGAAGLARQIADGRKGEADRAGRRRFMARPDPRAGRAYAALTVLFGILFLVVYYSFFAPTNFAGACFGFRWYIGFTPLVAYYAVTYFARFRRSPRVRTIFYVLGLVSLLFALIGLQSPWRLMENNLHPAVRFLMLLRGF